MASEIVIVALAGIDCASPDAKYTLRFRHGEHFSDPHLLSIQFVGFTRVWLDADTIDCV